MTGKTLREQLPVGDPRNKVEFLADELENRSAELLKLLGETGGIRSWINNGAFLDNISNKAHQTSFKGNPIPNAVLGSDNQNCASIGDSWAFEQSKKIDKNNVNSSFSAHRNLYFKGHNKSVPFENQTVWCHALNAKGALYQIIRLPPLNSEYKARVYFSCNEGAKIKIGWRTLSESGWLGGIRDSSEVVADSTFKMYRGHVEGDPLNAAYMIQTLDTPAHSISVAGDPFSVLFVEIDPQMTGSQHVHVHGVDVVRSDETPEWEAKDVIHQTDLRGTHRHVEGIEYTCRNFSPATPNEYEFKADIAGRSLPCASGFEKHLKLTGFYIGNSSYSLHSNGVKVLSVDGDKLTLFIPDNLIALFRDARYLGLYLTWSEMPVGIGFYQ